MKQTKYTYRVGTHESQKAPAEASSEAKDFMSLICLMVAEPNQHEDFIINMDQMPIPFTFNSKLTYDVVGTRSVHIRKSTNDTKRVTLAMSVTASGKILTPYLIFKGTRNGRIARNELSTLPNSMHYACQKNAWMDEECMMEWVDKVLKPYVDKAPDDVVPLLFLDSYRCHMMSSVVGHIQALGVQVEHIPGGCTGLCQPVDVGINCPFKLRVRDQWEAWMMADGILTGSTSPPTRANVAEWCKVAMETLPQQIIRNAWRKTGDYTWFAPTVHTCPPLPEEDICDSDDSSTPPLPEEEVSDSDDSSTLSLPEADDSSNPPLPEEEVPASDDSSSTAHIYIFTP
jgi:hypothetical protein